jgi:chromosome partitioning protein
MIIAIVQTKGGVGKTTLTVNLAVERVIRGKRDVLLVDADDQATASDFTALRTEKLGQAGYTAIQLTGNAVRSQVLSMKKKFDDILIDTGGRDSQALRAALTVAEIALIPFQPRSFDVWALDKIAALVEEARGFNPGLRAFALINCADASGPDNDAAAATLRDHTGIAYLDSPLGRRKAFPNSNALGLSVLEANPLDRKARFELTRLADHIKDLGHSRKKG